MESFNIKINNNHLAYYCIIFSMVKNQFKIFKLLESWYTGNIKIKLLMRKSFFERWFLKPLIWCQIDRFHTQFNLGYAHKRHARK